MHACGARQWRERVLKGQLSFVKNLEEEPTLDLAAEGASSTRPHDQSSSLAAHDCCIDNHCGRRVCALPYSCATRSLGLALSVIHPIGVALVTGLDGEKLRSLTRAR